MSAGFGVWPRPLLAQGQYAGSVSCRQCHEDFYKLWAPSHHGLAMQPYTAEFAQANLTDQAEAIAIGSRSYLAAVGADQGYVLEKGPEGEKRLPIVHVLGGKNVYYFLTPLDRGRLQTLPVAYDVNLKTWYDTAASGVRHFPGAQRDAPVHWTDPMYTFNTSCYDCHVSQLSTNYDLATDTYNTHWSEPGINCETCHGPAQEHVKVCRAALEGQVPDDLKIIKTGPFTAEQTNSMCGACHAKMSPVSASFMPGERYFDHFDLIVLDHADFYPDGRDLGENYTMTTWQMSPCVKSGQLDCVHCHTSSGRYRFAEPAKANDACLPCHAERVANVAAHTHHTDESGANRCIGCHMPMTRFARMDRSDHSMRPPTPATTLKYESPNACNLCHTGQDQDAAWADKYVRQWYEDDYQKPVLYRAGLIDAARKQDWKRLDEMLAYLGRSDRDEVTAASLIRLLRSCPSQDKWPVVIDCLKQARSPLVRAAAAEGLGDYLTAPVVETLLAATRDDYRLVRVRAAAALAGLDPQRLDEPYRSGLTKATGELIAGLNARADDYASHYNLGNFEMETRDYDAALASFQRAIRLRPDFVPSYVNAAFAYNATGRNDQAEASFRKAIELDPNSVPAYLNLGMLLGEEKRIPEAEKVFRKAAQLDPNSAVAAYNLGIILASGQPEESLRWCQKAYRLSPDEGRYGYTYAYFLHQGGQTGKAVAVLQDMVGRSVPYADAYVLLATLFLQQGQSDRAAGVYMEAQNNPGLTAQEREAFGAMIQRLQQGR